MGNSAFRNGRSAGFTLVEIMVVVAVVGFLLAAGVLSISKSRQGAMENIARTELEMIATAVQELAWDTGRYPNKALRNATDSTDNELELGCLSVGLVGLADAARDYFPNWSGPYLDEVNMSDDEEDITEDSPFGHPEDPWGNKYFFDPDYKVDGKSRAVVGSFGPNGSGHDVHDSDNIYVLID